MEETANVESESPVQAEGESTNATNGEPTPAAGLFDGMTGEQLHNSYKSLQTELGKRTEAFNEIEAKFQRYGGTDRILELADYLDNNESFADWVKGQQQANILGADIDDIDEDTKRAMDIVQGMSKAEINKMYQEKIAPLENHLKEQQLQVNVDAMSKKYENFNDMRETMAELAKNLPEHIQDNPSFEDMEDLYWKAVRVSGKIEEIAAKAYEAKLEKAKKQSMDTPTKKAEPTRLTGKLSMLASYEAAKAASN